MCSPVIWPFAWSNIACAEELKSALILYKVNCSDKKHRVKPGLEPVTFHSIQFRVHELSNGSFTTSVRSGEKDVWRWSSFNKTVSYNWNIDLSVQFQSKIITETYHQYSMVGNVHRSVQCEFIRKGVKKIFVNI